MTEDQQQPGGEAESTPTANPAAPTTKQHVTTEVDVELARVTSGDQAAVEKKRASMGFWAVAVSDVAIAAAAIVGVLIIHHNSTSTTAVVSILSSAFTAVGTLTTAYFGIKATANTAKNSIANK